MRQEPVAAGAFVFCAAGRDRGATFAAVAGGVLAGGGAIFAVAGGVLAAAISAGFAGTLAGFAALEAGGGAAFAFSFAMAMPFLRCSSGIKVSSCASVSLAGASPCAAARLT